MAIIDQEARAERAADLKALVLNGLRRVLIQTLDTTSSPSTATLNVQFQNPNHLAAILTDVAGGVDPSDILVIRGIRQARPVEVTAVQAGPDDSTLRLAVQPIGDYSMYTLVLKYENMDPLFSTIPFRFRPGCFSTDCDAVPTDSIRVAGPQLDYLAKDYDSFRHALIVGMQQRVPGWRPTSEADFSMVLIDLFSAAGDELSDFQDRVVHEAYLSRARSRISLARHARLMDYHVYQGNQATTWLALRVEPGPAVDLPAGFEANVLTAAGARSAVFRSHEPQHVDPLFNDIDLYTWRGAQPGLAAGAVEAELRVADEASARSLHDLIRDGTMGRLLIQEHLNPGTGSEAGRDPSKRQFLTLEVDELAPRVGQDPVTSIWYVHVRWRTDDRLRHDYCFALASSSVQAAQFHGNLLRVEQGRLVVARYSEDGTLADASLNLFPDNHDAPLEARTYARSGDQVLVELPADMPLLYRKTPFLPRGKTEPRSTARIKVRRSDGSVEDDWGEVISLVFSQEDHAHYCVETDQLGRSFLRFGDGVHGRALPTGAEVHGAYQTGSGLEGNVGADRIVHCSHAAVRTCWNPFDVTDGRAPEPRDEIVRNAPEAYRARQFRAVHLSDYARRAEELPEVSKAAAHYAWAGSWRAVRVTIDPAGGEPLSPELRRKIARHLDAVRLIGDDVEIRSPQFVPLIIDMRICVHPDFWPRDVRSSLAREFSSGYTADGSPGLFHPDEWTFGQKLRVSQLIGRALFVPGVEHILHVGMQRWDAITPGFPEADVVEVGPTEVIQVRNDPDHMELGVITFDLVGGRQ